MSLMNNPSSKSKKNDLQNFHADRSLTSNHIRIVERMNHRKSLLQNEPLCLSGGLVIVLDMMLHSYSRATEPSNGVHLDERGANGITIVASIPSLDADKATPCAWLPALHATTPRFLKSSSGSFLAILFYAPRILNENTG